MSGIFLQNILVYGRNGFQGLNAVGYLCSFFKKIGRAEIA